MRAAAAFVKMKLQDYFLMILILNLGVATSCAPAIHKETISLASFGENYVDVSIYLESSPDGEHVLSVMFTPPNGYHLYSKDIPVTGINGLGRPTLFELTPNSQLKAVGDLRESVKSQPPDFEPKELLVYPLGAVTLSLPVELPPGNGWVNDELSITYMACSASQCKPPVAGKIVLIRLPSSRMLDQQ